MKKIILAGLLATMMSSTPVLAAATSAPAQAATAKCSRQAFSAGLWVSGSRSLTPLPKWFALA